MVVEEGQRGAEEGQEEGENVAEEGENVPKEGQNLDEEGNKAVQKWDSSKALKNGLVLFRIEFFKKFKPEKCVVHNDEVLKAWRSLTNKERKEYSEKAKYSENAEKSRPEKKSAKKKVAFIMRSSIANSSNWLTL